MNKILLMIALSLTATLAVAQASDQGCESSGGKAAGCSTSTSTSTNVNTNLNSVSSKVSVSNKVQQGQEQSQKQGQVQGQSIKNSGNSAAYAGIGEGANANSNNTNVTVQGDNFDTPRIPVSSASAPTVFPTAPCMGSSSGGVQGLSVGISLGSSWESTECIIGETARGFDQAGYKEDALTVRCQGKYAKAAPSCQALAAKQAVKEAADKKVAEAVVEAKKPVAVAKPTAKIAEVVVAKVAEPVKSSNGAYSVTTNPLAQ